MTQYKENQSLQSCLTSVWFFLVLETGTDSQPFLADFSGFSYLELKGLHTFERDLGLVGQEG